MADGKNLVIPNFAEGPNGALYSLVVKIEGHDIASLPETLAKEIQRVALCIYGRMRQDFSLEDLERAELTLKGKGVSLNFPKGVKKTAEKAEVVFAKKLYETHGASSRQIQKVRKDSLILERIGDTVGEAFEVISDLALRHQFVHLPGQSNPFVPPLAFAPKVLSIQKRKNSEEDSDIVRNHVGREASQPSPIRSPQLRQRPPVEPVEVEDFSDNEYFSDREFNQGHYKTVQAFRKAHQDRVRLQSYQDQYK